MQLGPAVSANGADFDADRDDSQRQSTSPSFEGELILDGSALGAWMIRHLADHLADTPTGTTGPDPRVVPTTPGAPLFF
jgi:hypothetical protein